MGKENFQFVHRFLREGSPKEALSLLLNSKGNRLRYVFWVEKNHAWYCVGEAKYMQMEYTEAFSAYRRAYYLDKSDWRALMAMANCCDQQKNPRRAIRFLHAALLRVIGKKDRVRVLYNLANAYFDAGDCSKALEYYKETSSASGDVGVMSRKNAKLAAARLDVIAGRKGIIAPSGRVRSR